MILCRSPTIGERRVTIRIHRANQQEGKKFCNLLHSSPTQKSPFAKEIKVSTYLRIVQSRIDEWDFYETRFSVY